MILYLTDVKYDVRILRKDTEMKVLFTKYNNTN